MADPVFFVRYLPRDLVLFLCIICWAYAYGIRKVEPKESSYCAGYPGVASNFCFDSSTLATG